MTQPKQTAYYAAKPAIAPLVAHFQKAAQKLQYPRITIHDPAIGKIVIRQAPDGGKNAGFLYVNVDGEYKGKVSPGGSYYIVGDPSTEGARLLTDLMRKILQDPVNTLAITGKKMGACCFCSLPLTNASSVHHGYGPTCAENFGLPWGDTPKSTESTESTDNTTNLLKGI